MIRAEAREDGVTKQRILRGEGPRASAGGDLHTHLLCGIDNLGAIEALFGEAIGDEVVAAVEHRIAPLLPARARLWRPERRRIGVSVRELDRMGASALFAAMQAAIAQRAIETVHGPVAVTLAAGCVTAADSDADDARAAVRHALAEAMASGVGCLRFAGDTGVAAGLRRSVVDAARIAMGAIGSGDLVIAYQPVVHAGGARRAAFHECLVRVRERSGKLIAAGEFMPAMEQLGLATLIDRQVLLLALDALTRTPGIRVSVNIYPQTMQDAQWMMLFHEGTRHDPTLAERLIIEVTETAAMLDPARTREFMNRLRRAGCAFALDDFGMGHTSFGSLRDFRFDMIKIDGSFVTDITTNPDSRFFVEKMVEVAGHFEMMTVAEFVQGAAEARILHDLGVDYFQGFFFGRPSLILGATLEPEAAIAG